MFDKFKSVAPVSLEKSLVFNLLNELQEVGVKAITYVGGGEPTLHKDFDEIITRSYEMGFEVGLVTNGEIIDTKIDLLKKCCKFVRVSLDAGTRKTHDILHKPKSNDFKKLQPLLPLAVLLKG
jgi:MoaA/NifB/PqqE/SkfB family radical SAM enzyme